MSAHFGFGGVYDEGRILHKLQPLWVSLGWKSLRWGRTRSGLWSGSGNTGGARATGPEARAAAARLVDSARDLERELLLTDSEVTNFGHRSKKIKRTRSLLGLDIEY